MRVLYYNFICFISIIILWGCSSTKYLQKDEYLLYKNSVEKAPKRYNEALKGLYKQKANRKLFGTLPYLSMYNYGKKFLDTAKIIEKAKKYDIKYTEKIAKATNETKKAKFESKLEKKEKQQQKKLHEGNFFMRNFGEPPSIYDSSLTKTTAQNLRIYLISKGYFHAKTEVRTDTLYKKKRIKATYIITPGDSFIVKEFKTSIEDPKLDSMVIKKTALFKELMIGDQYDEDKLTEERENIYALLKNRGYLNFKRQNILYELDTLEEPGKVSINLVIEGKYDVFHLSKMYFNFDVSNNTTNSPRDTFSYRSVDYTYYKKTYLRKLVDYKIRTRPYDLYNDSKLQTTQKLLGRLDLYKFVNIYVAENKKDTSNHTVTVTINTSPLNRFQISQEYGLSVNQAYVPGPFLSLSLRSRNLIRALETIDYTFRYSLDGQVSVSDPNQVYRTQELNASATLTLPQTIFPGRFRDKLSEYNPRTRIYAGYNLVNRPEYKRETFRASLTYTIERNKYSNLFITPIDISVISSVKDSAFNALLNDLKVNSGSNLYLSFLPSIVTNFNVSYVYSNFELGVNKKAKYFRPSAEIGGLIPTLYANLFGTGGDAKNNILFDKQFFDYIRFTADLRYYFPLSKNSTFVMRFNGGYAQPIGNSNSTALFSLPYEKYFFAGGSSSNRAWKPRRLGPGSYFSDSLGYKYEQPGEILFETNYELRFKMIKFLEGALFVDAGNVWAIKSKDQSKEFKGLNSISEIAVGGGVGIRLNFSFLIIRVDLANKIWDPGKPLQQRFVGRLSLYDTAINIGIGYPF